MSPDRKNGLPAQSENEENDSGFSNAASFLSDVSWLRPQYKGVGISGEIEEIELDTETTDIFICYLDLVGSDIGTMNKLLNHALEISTQKAGKHILTVPRAYDDDLEQLPTEDALKIWREPDGRAIALASTFIFGGQSSPPSPNFQQNEDQP